LKDHHGGAGIIFSAKRKFIKVGKRKVQNRLEGVDGTKHRKIGGELRHTVHTLKKVARLSSKDRNAVLCTLKKRASNKKQPISDDSPQGNSDEVSSSASVNKEWNNWVVLHGKEKEAVEDVWGIGKDLGLQFQGETHNMFEALARKGDGKRESRRLDEGGRGRAVGGEM
jgi:hypothetical protein